MNSRLLDHLVKLTHEALSEVAGPALLSSVIYKAIRIARLRSDWENLWWLEFELCSFDAKQVEDLKKRLGPETGAHFTRADLQALLARTVDAFMTERSVQAVEMRRGRTTKEDRMLSGSVPALERAIESVDRIADQLTVPTGLHPVDLYFEHEKMREIKVLLAPTRSQAVTVLDRIRSRVNAFLSTTERQLFLGQVNSDIFERNRQYVDRRLLEVAPDVAEQFAAAYKRLDSDEGPEALSQALTSCRRALKSLADRLYPASATPVVGADGKNRVLTDAQFVNRLWQFVYEKSTGSVAGRTTLASLEDLGNRLDRLNEFSSKGVHATISVAEAEQCVIQTYLLMGDILRLVDSK